MSFTSAFMVFQNYREHEQQELQANTTVLKDAISASVLENYNKLVGLKAYFDTADNVTRDNFTHFTDVLLQDAKGIQALEWIPRILHNQRRGAEDVVRFYGFSDFEFRQFDRDGHIIRAKDRKEYYPVYFVEPFPENQQAFGLDLASETTRRRGLFLARDTGKTVTVGPIKLAQGADGVLVMLPVYESDIPHTTLLGRHKALRGFILGVFRLDHIIGSVLAMHPLGASTGLEIIDVSVPGSEKKLFSNNFLNSTDIATSFYETDLKPRYEIPLPFQTSKWSLSVQKRTSMFMPGYLSVWYVLVTGLVMTVMLMAMVQALVNREAFAAEQVRIKTALLSEKEKQAQIIARKAEVASEAKTNFLATMSHEIRTPLNGILGMAQLLNDTTLSKDQNKKVAGILSSGSSLLDIVNNVLDMSKIEAGSMELEMAIFDLAETISATVLPFNSDAKETGVTFSLDMKIDDVFWVAGDRTRLQQVVLNLLSNAFKFTSEGEISLSVNELQGSASNFIHGADCVIALSVKDSGKGISSEKLETIFDPFTQEDTSITRKFGGSGLGLSIVKQLIELMGGSIIITSEEGVGTHCHLVIPFVLPDADEIAVKEGKNDQGKENASDNVIEIQRKKLQILLAEDNMMNAVIAKAFLNKFGHDVVHVENGQLAVDAVTQQNFDVVLMDVHMPEMNGMEASNIIRKTNNSKDLPIIGLTAEAFEERHKEFRAAGMNCVITKPFTEEQLDTTLQKYGNPS
ncbi:CHASE domain-containing protein [Kiloniella sp. EL199]|uniref:CHASE domain-containing protein n=1 Tax=Kiloniella sp. EL199 TaxID=2107581 RepID=UPI0013C438AB|nr:CHASE domain-containing protein [Kiloniella sp. EL199]